MKEWLNWKTGAAVLAFFAAMGSAAATWDKFGWWKPASVHYVDMKLDPIASSNINTQIDVANAKRDSAQRYMYELEDSIEDATDPEKKRRYRDRHREQETIKGAVEDQLKTLKEQLKALK